jgi:VIT1/CCC1 family predicted Fe2+/Mn2+ transporter
VVSGPPFPTSHTHLPGEPVHEEGHVIQRAPWLEEAVFGVLDGVITSLALVVTVAGVLAIGYRSTFLAVIAAAIGGGLSMFVGALLGARAQARLIGRERAREEREIVERPQVMREELRHIYRSRGFSDGEVEILTNRVTADPKRWVDTMMRDELHLPPEAEPEPFRHGAVIGASYVVAAIIPAIPFLVRTVSLRFDVAVSMVLGGLELVGVGVLQARYAEESPLKGIGEVLLAGLGTTLLVLLVTLLLQG